MAKKYNIEEYRKSIRRKKILNKVLTIFLVLFSVVIMFFVFRTIYINGQIETKNTPTFPVSLKNESPTHINKTSTNIVVTTLADIIFFSENGAKETAFAHGYANPVTKTKKSRVLTYDQGGYSVRVDTKAGNLATIKTQTTILFCEINASGYLAVATAETRFTSSITIYDNNYKEICKYSTNEYVMALDFKSNKECVILTQQAKNGDFNTVLYEFNFNKEVETLKVEFEGFFSLDLHKKENSNMIVVGKNSILLLDPKANKLSEFNLNSDLVNICTMYDKYTIIATKNLINPNHSDVYLFDNDGLLIKEITIQGMVKDIYCDAESLMVLDENNIYSYDFELSEQKTYPVSEGYTNFTKYDSSIYAINQEILQKIQ